MFLVLDERLTRSINDSTGPVKKTFFTLVMQRQTLLKFTLQWW